MAETTEPHNDPSLITLLLKQQAEYKKKRLNFSIILLIILAVGVILIPLQIKLTGDALRKEMRTQNDLVVQALGETNARIPQQPIKVTLDALPPAPTVELTCTFPKEEKTPKRRGRR